MFVVDDIAIAAATEVSTEIAAEVATEAASEVATNALSEIASEGVSELATEGVTDIVSDASNEMLTEGISNISPETLVDPSDVSNITGSESNIIGDNIGEINELDPTNSSLDRSVEIKGDEVRDLSSNELSESGNLEQSDLTDSSVPENVDDSPRTIKTINDGLVGQNHPDTGIPYVEKEVVTDTGEKVKGVFPEFESKFDVQLPEELQQAPDRTQFAECNKQLQEKVATDPELRSQFSEDQLADIEDGYTPEGYTWHHNEELGKMQLVDSDIHSQTRHTGERNIWGGGTENRH